MAACNVDSFLLGGGAGGDAGDIDQDGGGGNGDGGAGADADLTPDAAPPDASCVPQDEVCDGQDQDCDDEIDEDFNLQEDPANCGMCGNRCSLGGAAGTCSAGECSFECLGNFRDLNGDLNMPNSDGCEYLCTPTNGGVEACDFTDNDCDGLTDEGFGLDTDVDNCGACGNACNILNAVETCTAGQCGFTDCEQGFADVFDTVPGCEYQCPVFPTESEDCDNVDDDCDGTVDEGVSGGNLGQACTDPGFETQADTGECAFGAVVCSFGSEVCDGYVGPTSEVCNNLDDDCDGTVDNGFDLQNDLNNCGSCGTTCSLQDAVATCSAGSCAIAACSNGFVDLDNNPANGCEYECTPSGPEVCDGRDNDCDGTVDNPLGTPGEMLPPPAGLCNTLGACAGTEPSCTGLPDGCTDTVVTWRCDYADNNAAVEADACFELPAQEALCDVVDGDCDGATDEAFIQLDQECDDGELGECRGVGTFQCNGANDGVECIIAPEDEGATATTDETACDNKDEDCDGIVDENAPDFMVGIDNNGDNVFDFFIDAYEASRPDATGVSVGGEEHQACSNPDVLPWTNVTFLEADAACAAAGKRLCTEAEWQLSCEGTGASVFPYGDTYDPFACNGNDFDQDCGADPADSDDLLSTGFLYGCPTPLASCEQDEWAGLTGNDRGTFDMAGNVKEWTSTAVGGNARRIRGGAFDSAEQGMTCQFDFVSASEDFLFPNLGFRCCADVTP